MFKQKKHKRFTYTARFLSEQEEHQKNNLSPSLNVKQQSLSRKGVSVKTLPRLTLLLLVLAAIIAVMYYLDTKLR